MNPSHSGKKTSLNFADFLGGFGETKQSGLADSSRSQLDLNSGLRWCKFIYLVKVFHLRSTLMTLQLIYKCYFIVWADSGFLI